ncbi:YhcH/YjgK/YiaL family protein [Vibrio sp.]|uniref:DUF386 domain-containing protein n=1 Tax=Vibrio viridaestus TaxID=2487322 RepID=A0A3N9U500_9VIBR|nr:YhcH/YjgK/YiaL family protein [Vibrio viridaestus]MDC0609438.1 YhcH/YjgK/YiaL family protein [Vibrio sp.]RQW64772.1 DUF386 domain-containing protein [Vibrio viridaestus]
MIISKFGCSDNQALFSPLVNDIFDYVTSMDLDNLAPGKYDIKHIESDEAFFLVQEYETLEESQFGAEFHQTYTDVQFLLYGEERFGWAIASDEEYRILHRTCNFDQDRDIGFIGHNNNLLDLNENIMKPGAFYVFTPRTIHMPSLAISTPTKVKKIVIKIETSLLSDSVNFKPMSTVINESPNLWAVG